MSQSPIMDARRGTTEIDRRVLLAGTALASFATLLLELALTRLFSVVLYYHFAFLAISLAMLGLGAGGVFSYVWRNWLAQWGLRELANLICALNVGAALLALWVALHTRVLLIIEPENLLRLTAIYATAGLPFFFTGLLFSLVFARETKHLALLYGADLTGGAFACLAVVPLLNMLGGPSAVVCAAVAMAMAASVWADTSLRRKTAFGIAVLLIAVLVANRSQRLIDVVYGKGALIAQPSTEFSRWNAISRVEVDDQREYGKWIRIDAEAATLMVSADARDPKSVSYVEKWASSSAIPNLLRPRGDYAIIGPGGGIDVLGAVVGGSPNVTGIDINPIIVSAIVGGRYADYVHHLYQLPQVHIYVSEGRSWIRSSRDKFDVIQMTLVDTWASTSAGAFALSENNLYTVEAFREYFDHLKPDGFLAITRWEFSQPHEALRVVSLGIEALRRLGVEDVRKHFIVVENGQPNGGGQPVTVLVKKAPVTIGEERTVLKRVQVNPNLYPLYTPYVYGRPDESAVCSASEQTGGPANCIETDLVRIVETRKPTREQMDPFQQIINLSSRTAVSGTGPNPRSKFIRDYPFEITPVTDNAPFFFFTFKTRSALHTLLAGGNDSIDWKTNLGLVVLGMMLMISIMAVLGFLIGPLALHEAAHKPSLTPMLYFVAIGVGYILVEIALIQRFVLFLGHPTYAMTVVVFLMMLSGGAGSVASKYWLNRTLNVRAVLGAIVGLVILYVLFLHSVLGTLVGVPFAGKLLLSGVLLVPLGFLMGMPFPTGLREIATGEGTLQPVFSEDSPATARNTIEWAWALNAASGVLGSALAIIIAIHFGLDATLGCAAGAYVVAAALTLPWQKSRLDQPCTEEARTEVSVEV